MPEVPEKSADAGSEVVRLIAEQRTPLRRFVAHRIDRRLRGRIDPSDVVQDVCLEAVRRFDHFERSGKIGFFDWLCSLAKDRLVDLRRTHVDYQRRSVRREVRDGGSNESASIASRLIADQTSPSQNAIRSEGNDQLQRALAQLPEIDREIIDLRDFARESNAAIARRLGISESAASARYVRALERLGELLRRGDDLRSEDRS